VVNEKCAVSYQIAAEGGGGIVSARDFVNIRYCDILNGVYVCSGSSFVYFFRHLFFLYLRRIFFFLVGASIVFPDMPPQKGFVRGENGPGCWVMTPVANEPNKCVFQWLLDTNLKVCKNIFMGFFLISI